MAKKTRKKSTSKVSNSTLEKLKGTPFSSAEEMKRAQNDILKETWRKLELARAKKELTKREEFKFFLEVFKKGMICKYGEKSDDLVRVSLADDDSIKVTISEEVKSKENNEKFVGILIESMSSSFLANYLKAMDVVDLPNEDLDTRRAGKEKRK